MRARALAPVETALCLWRAAIRARARFQIVRIGAASRLLQAVACEFRRQIRTLAVRARASTPAPVERCLCLGCAQCLDSYSLRNPHRAGAESGNSNRQ